MKDVFDRTALAPGVVEISDSLYNLTMGLVLCYGFFVNWLMVKYIPYAALESINPFVFLLVYFGSCFLGVYLFTKFNKPILSFIGYSLVVVPFGAIINMVVYRYNPLLVIQAIKITGVVTGSMMVLGTLFPAFFRKIAMSLTISLLLVIIWELFDIFILKIHHDIIDWIVVVIFCGYVGVDWGRANQIPKTIDNAIDSAAALYMDIINLFLRILRILGRRR
jgi:FtsH-binding integral membrane protein